MFRAAVWWAWYEHRAGICCLWVCMQTGAGWYIVLLLFWGCCRWFGIVPLFRRGAAAMSAGVAPNEGVTDCVLYLGEKC